MSEFELVKHTLQWVWGACILWNQVAKQFDINTPGFQEFVQRTHTVTWRHLRDQQRLDGTCSDFECVVASDAEVLFGKLVRETNVTVVDN